MEKFDKMYGIVILVLATIIFALGVVTFIYAHDPVTRVWVFSAQSAWFLLSLNVIIDIIRGELKL